MANKDKALIKVIQRIKNDIDDERLITQDNWVKDIESFHQVVAELFDLPDYYGKNLDALWDCLGDCVSDWGSEKVQIIWIDHQLSIDAISKDKFEKIIGTFNELRIEFGANLEVILS